MRIVAIIQARLGSTRLPCKVLADIEGRPMLERVMQRALEIRGVDRVVVAFPYRDALASAWFMSTADLYAFAWTGSPQDVLGRFDAAAREHEADVVMRLTADCPLLDPEICERVLLHYLVACSFVAVAGTREPNGDGFDCEVFSAHMLRLAHLKATDAHDREHVTPWIWEHGRPYVVTLDGDAPKLSVDTQEDLDRVRAIYRHVGRDVFSRTEALAACAAQKMVEGTGRV